MVERKLSIPRLKTIRTVQGNQKFSKIDNPLINAPHTAIVVTDDNWSKNYSREIAAYPSQSNKEFKYWPSVGRVDNAHGDRNLICTCPPIDEYE